MEISFVTTADTELLNKLPKIQLYYSAFAKQFLVCIKNHKNIQTPYTQFLLLRMYPKKRLKIRKNLMQKYNVYNVIYNNKIFLNI